MTTQLAPLTVQHFTDNNGNMLAGGQLYTYAAGTSTPLATYTDSTGGTANANPVIMNARGEANVWTTGGLAYKFVLEDASGVTIWTVDNITDGSLDSALAAALANTTDPTKGAALVGWFRSLAGVIGRSLASWLGWQSISVYDFMTTAQVSACQALSTTTDVSSAWQTAINAANGKTLKIPAGNHLIATGLTIPAGCTFDIEFENGAKIIAGANNITIFTAATNWYTSKIIEPNVDGNGFTGVTVFDLTNFVTGSAIIRPTFTNLGTGVIYRSLCYGSVLDTPDCRNVNAPVVVMAGSSNLQIRSPAIDGFGSIGIDVQNGGSLKNVGVEVLGGYIQGGGIGVRDAAISTKVKGTYFETCTVADVSLIAGSSFFNGMVTNHTATGVVAYMGRGAISARIYNPFMSSGGRSTGLFDFDNTCSYCLADFRTGPGGENIPTGNMTGISTVLGSPPPIGNTLPNTGSFTTISASGVITALAGDRVANGLVNALAPSTPATMFSASARGIYDVVALIANSGGAAAYTSSARVILDGNGQRITADNGTGLSISLGTYGVVQVTHTAGIAENIAWAYRFLPV